MPFENLSGDPSLDLDRSTAPGILSHEWNGSSHVLPVAAGSPSDAYLLNASQLVHGYFDRRSGKLHFEISVEDLTRHKMVQSESIGRPFKRAKRIRQEDRREGAAVLDQ